ncbi:hypothetical protein [Rhodoligotrophos defluvii]|uniref:hypothetical protein n=1 Tax=Rhodoligotrophos defluvii TaxID=2561934 RepID=UPI0010C9EC1B|nr:hypothetical protein [Rhodoligotrophos defluvii]
MSFKFGPLGNLSFGRLQALHEDKKLSEAADYFTEAAHHTTKLKDALAGFVNFFKRHQEPEVPALAEEPVVKNGVTVITRPGFSSELEDRLVSTVAVAEMNKVHLPLNPGQKEVLKEVYNVVEGTPGDDELKAPEGDPKKGNLYLGEGGINVITLTETADTIMPYKGGKDVLKNFDWTKDVVMVPAVAGPRHQLTTVDTRREEDGHVSIHVDSDRDGLFDYEAHIFMAGQDQQADEVLARLKRTAEINRKESHVGMEEEEAEPEDQPEVSNENAAAFFEALNAAQEPTEGFRISNENAAAFFKALEPAQEADEPSRVTNENAAAFFHALASAQSVQSPTDMLQMI